MGGKGQSKGGKERTKVELGQEQGIITWLTTYKEEGERRSELGGLAHSSWLRHQRDPSPPLVLLSEGETRYMLN